VIDPMIEGELQALLADVALSAHPASLDDTSTVGREEELGIHTTARSKRHPGLAHERTCLGR